MQSKCTLYSFGMFKSYVEIMIISSTSLALPISCTYFLNVETKSFFTSLEICKTSYFVYLVHTCLIVEKCLYRQLFLRLHFEPHTESSVSVIRANCMNVARSTCRDFVICLILTKVIMWSRISVKIPHLKIHKILSGGIGIIPCGQTERHTSQV